MRGSTIARRRVAVLGTLLWLLAVELLPAAHLAHHRVDHTHAADGSIVADHHHDVAGRDVLDLDHTGRLVMDHPAHDAAGLAHHAIALAQPPPPLVACDVSRAARREVRLVAAQLSSAPPAAPAARGPPVIWLSISGA